MLSGIAFLHDCGIIHTDIKPGISASLFSPAENVMFYPIEDIPDTDPDVVPVVSFFRCDVELQTRL